MTASEAELQRSIDRVEQSVALLVRTDVYLADQRTSKAALQNLKDDIEDIKQGVAKMEERRASERRAYLTSLILPALLLVLQIYLYSRVGGA